MKQIEEFIGFCDRMRAKMREAIGSILLAAPLRPFSRREPESPRRLWAIPWVAGLNAHI